MQRFIKKLCQLKKRIMKIYHLLFFASLLLAGSSCKKTVEKQADTNTIEVELDNCNSITIKNQVVEICYLTLVEESRCPANANCVWQGAATGRFKLKLNGAESIFELSTLDMKPHYETSINISGYKIKLLAIHPYPGLSGTEHKAELSIQPE